MRRGEGLVVTILVLAVALALPASPAAARRQSYQRGMTMWGWTPTAYAEPAADAALARLRRLGVTWVTFVPTWFQPGGTAGTVGPRADFTATDAALRHAVVRARSLGLRVTIKPHVDRGDGGWRGDIRPADLDAWFSRYGEFARHYAALAAAAGADQFVVGTELFGVSSHTARWRALIRSVRSVFAGTLTYAALPFEYDRIGFWDALDLIGVDAYWRLSSRAERDPGRLRAAWRPIVAELEAASRRWGKPVLLTEAGYASQVGTVTDPSSWTLSARAAPLEQAAAYTALLDVFERRPWFAGVHWWAWRATNRPEPTDFTPQDKPAELVLVRRWAR